MGNDASKGASGDEAVGAAPSSQVEIDEALLESCWSRLQALNKSMNMDQDQYEDLNDAIIRVSGGDGTITEVQFVEACTEVLTPESEGGPSLVLLKCMFETYDRSNQGNITVEELTVGFSAMFGHSDTEGAAVDIVFELYDADLNGGLDVTELEDYLLAVLTMGEAMLKTRSTERQLVTHAKLFATRMLREMDVDGDEMVSPDEFRKWFERTASTHGAPPLTDDSSEEVANSPHANLTIQTASPPLDDESSEEVLNSPYAKEAPPAPTSDDDESNDALDDLRKATELGAVAANAPATTAHGDEESSEEVLNSPHSSIRSPVVISGGVLLQECVVQVMSWPTHARRIAEGWEAHGARVIGSTEWAETPTLATFAVYFHDDDAAEDFVLDWEDEAPRCKFVSSAEFEAIIHGRVRNAKRALGDDAPLSNGAVGAEASAAALALQRAAVMLNAANVEEVSAFEARASSREPRPPPSPFSGKLDDEGHLLSAALPPPMHRPSFEPRERTAEAARHLPELTPEFVAELSRAFAACSPAAASRTLDLESIHLDLPNIRMLLAAYGFHSVGPTMLAELDTDGSRTLEWSEFLAFIESHHAAMTVAHQMRVVSELRRTAGGVLMKRRIAC